MYKQSTRSLLRKILNIHFHTINKSSKGLRPLRLQNNFSLLGHFVRATIKKDSIFVRKRLCKKNIQTYMVARNNL